MHTLQKFLVGSEIRLRCHEIALNGHHASPFAAPGAEKHYQCELYGAPGQLPVTTIMGSNDGPPEVAEVLDALAADAAVVDQCDSYEEWALCMGFDPDSRRGERIFRAERRRAKLLRALLGVSAYRTLLWEIERL